MESRTDTPARARRTAATIPATTSASLPPEAGSCVISETQVPESVPHFKSFDHISDERVRRAKDYEQYLQGALGKFPEFKLRIETEIAYAKSEQARSKTSDRDRVYLALNDGPLTCAEVIEDTGLPYTTVFYLLKELMELGLVSATQRKGIAGNKPFLVYSLA